MSNFTAIDFETARGDRASICQLGLVVVEQCKIVERITFSVQPPNNLYSAVNIGIHGITPEQTRDEETFDKVYLKIKPYIEGKSVVAHNALFEIDCLAKALMYYKMPVPSNIKWFCTLKIFKAKLAVACAMNGIKFPDCHSQKSLNDAEACALLMIKDIIKSN
jgi:DNA polymerase-3 subunit epsilon